MPQIIRPGQVGAESSLVERVTGVVLLGLLSFSLVRLLLIWSETVQFPYPINYGEGPLLLSAALLAEGQNIYPNSFGGYPYVVTEHPPVVVSFLATGISLFGVNYLFGRLVAIVATIASAVSIYAILAGLHHTHTAAITSSLLFLVSPFVLAWSNLVRVDMPALAFSLAGLALLVNRPRRFLELVMSVVLLALAAYSRQTYLVAAPFAASCWLLVTDRKRLRLFIGLYLGLVLLPAFVLNWITSGGFYLNVISSNLQAFDVGRLGLVAPRLIVWFAVMIGLALLELIRLVRLRQPDSTVLIAYLLGSLASLFAFGKEGASVNYFLEWNAALTLITGAAVARWTRKPPSRWRLILPVLLVLQCLLLGLAAQGPWLELRRTLAQRAEIGELEELLKRESGLVLADHYLGLLVSNHQEIALRPFHFSHMAAAGRWDQTPLLHDIKAQHFRMILISDQEPLFSHSLARSRWSPELWEAIHRYYQPDEIIAGTTILKPASH